MTVTLTTLFILIINLKRNSMEQVYVVQPETLVPQDVLSVADVVEATGLSS